jgi:geranylgeranyl pyrophosphate synthase
VLREYAEKVDSALKQLSISNTRLGAAAAEAVVQGGKRIRPAVALLACEAVSGSYDRAIPVAVAYELAHAASLSQDDIIDESPTRRGSPTTHKRYGTANAILISDVLIFKIFEILGGYGETPLSKQRLASLITHMGAAARKTAEGEFLEMLLASKANPTESDYINVAGLKTGSLFAAAAASGAIVGKAGRKAVDELYEYGYDVGIAFQILDDILDIAGNINEMGKPALKDLQNNATNVVLMHALNNAGADKRNAINSMMWRKSYGLADVQALHDILDELGSIKYASNLSDYHASAAAEHLRRLPKSKARDKLEELSQVLKAKT